MHHIRRIQNKRHLILELDPRKLFKIRLALRCETAYFQRLSGYVAPHRFFKRILNPICNIICSRCFFLGFRHFPRRLVHTRTRTHSRILGRLEHVHLTAVLLGLICLVKHIRPLPVAPLPHLRYLQPAQQILQRTLQLPFQLAPERQLPAAHLLETFLANFAGKVRAILLRSLAAVTLPLRVSLRIRLRLVAVEVRVRILHRLMLSLLLAEQPLSLRIHHPLRPRVNIGAYPVLARPIKLVKSIVQLLLAREKHAHTVMPHNLVKHRILHIRHIRMIRQHNNYTLARLIITLRTPLSACRQLISILAAAYQLNRRVQPFRKLLSPHAHTVLRSLVSRLVFLRPLKSGVIIAALYLLADSLKPQAVLSTDAAAYTLEADTAARKLRTQHRRHHIQRERYILARYALHYHVRYLAPRNYPRRLEIPAQHRLNLRLAAQLPVDAAAVPVHKTHRILGPFGPVAAPLLALRIISLHNYQLRTVERRRKLVVKRIGTYVEIRIIGNTAGRPAVTLHQVNLAAGSLHTLLALLPAVQKHRSTPLAVNLPGHRRTYTALGPLNITVTLLQRTSVKLPQSLAVLNQTVTGLAPVITIP